MLNTQAYIRYAAAAAALFVASAVLVDAAPYSHKLVPLTPRLDESIYKKGSVLHSESMPPLDASLQEGRTFEPPALVKLEHANSWYQIPDWLAGTWKSESEIRYYKYDYGTGNEDCTQSRLTARANETFGFQRDRIGGIWHFDHSPFMAVVDGGTSYTVQLTDSLVPLEITDQKAVLKFKSKHVIVSKRSDTILRVWQGESIQTYTPAASRADGFVKVDGSIKEFDRSGTAITLQQNVSGLTRIKPFSVRETCDGKPLRPNFVAYLKRRHLMDRIPK